MVRSKLAVLRAIEAGVAPVDIPDKAATHVGDFWERLGYLTRTGHMNREFVYGQWGGVMPRWWARLLPSTLAWRERDQEPRIWSDFEWLARMMAEMNAKAGFRDVRGSRVAARQLRSTSTRRGEPSRSRGPNGHRSTCAVRFQLPL
jgi:hypothetical protein